MYTCDCQKETKIVTVHETVAAHIRPHSSLSNKVIRYEFQTLARIYLCLRYIYRYRGSCHSFEKAYGIFSEQHDFYGFFLKAKLFSYQIVEPQKSTCTALNVVWFYKARVRRQSRNKANSLIFRLRLIKNSSRLGSSTRLYELRQYDGGSTIR